MQLKLKIKKRIIRLCKHHAQCCYKYGCAGDEFGRSRLFHPVISLNRLPRSRRTDKHGNHILWSKYLCCQQSRRCGSRRKPYHVLPVNHGLSQIRRPEQYPSKKYYDKSNCNLPHARKPVIQGFLSCNAFNNQKQPLIHAP